MRICEERSCMSADISDSFYVQNVCIQFREVSQDPLKDLVVLEAPTGDLDRMLAEIDEGRQ
jgi:hypothetical protein